MSAADELLALLRKYQTLATLRREREQSGTLAPRTVLRALAREFPGALRELDTVSLDELDRKARALSETARGRSEPEPWMTWMAAYHATMRAALLVRARLIKRVPFDTENAVAAWVAERSTVPVDEAFVRAIARPPGGRLNRAVFERLGAQFAAAPDEIWETLFPARRPGRYVRR